MNAPVVTLQMPPLHARQIEIVQSQARFKTLVCGRRFGKSRVCLWDALRRAIAGQLVWWVAPINKLGEGAWRTANRMLRGVPIVDFRKVEKTMYTQSGGMLVWRNADEPEHLVSEGLDHIVLDETDLMPEEVWTSALRPSLADRQGSAWFAGTPKRENGWFHRMFKRGASDDPLDAPYAGWQLPSWENPFLDPEEIEQARRDMPDILFRREFGAEFVSAEGARVKREMIRYGDPPRRAMFQRVALALDLAISEKKKADWTAAAVIGICDGVLWVLDVRRARVGFRGALEFVESLAEKWQPDSVIVESVAYQRALVEELLRSTPLPVYPVTPRGDKIARFAGLEARYEQNAKSEKPFIVHSRDLSPAFEEELLSFPVGIHDDQIDALAYAYEDVMKHGSQAVAYVSRSERRAAPRFRV